jgi:hypothetical protein
MNREKQLNQITRNHSQKIEENMTNNIDNLNQGDILKSNFNSDQVNKKN